MLKSEEKEPSKAFQMCDPATGGWTDEDENVDVLRRYKCGRAGDGQGRCSQGPVAGPPLWNKANITFRHENYVEEGIIIPFPLIQTFRAELQRYNY